MITPHQLHDRLQQGEKLALLDVRTPAEHAALHVPGVHRGTSNVISLERQVRIAAGVIVLTGALLAHLVNPVFIWLSGFVGAGLVLAGSTGWCGMGMLIAKIPWNQQGVDASGAR